MIYRGLSIFMRPLLETYIEAGIRFENSLLRQYGFADDDRKYMDYDNLRQKDADVTFWTHRLLEDTSRGYRAKVAKLEVSHLEDLASLLDIIAPAIRILLTPHFLDLIIKADDEMCGSFKLELAHGLCKDADVLDSFDTDRDEYSDLYRILDSRKNTTWLPGKKHGTLKAGLMESRSFFEQVYPWRDRRLLLFPRLDHDKSVMSVPLPSQSSGADEPRPEADVLKLTSPHISLDSLSASAG